MKLESCRALYRMINIHGPITNENWGASEKETLASQLLTFPWNFVSLEAWKTDQIYLNIVHLDYSIYPGIINHISMKNDKYGGGGYCIYVMSTIKFAPATACKQDGASGCCKFFINGCSSSMAAVGLSAGFLWKQHFKKSLASYDNESGIVGVSRMTLNIAAACINRWTCNHQPKKVKSTELIKSNYQLSVQYAN